MVRDIHASPRLANSVLMASTSTFLTLCPWILLLDFQGLCHYCFWPVFSLYTLRLLESLWFGYSSSPPSLFKQTLQELKFCKAQSSQLSPKEREAKTTKQEGVGYPLSKVLETRSRIFHGKAIRHSWFLARLFCHIKFSINHCVTGIWKSRSDSELMLCWYFTRSERGLAFH